MAKKGLLTKMFGKQNSDCCSVSFEEVSEENNSEQQQEGRRQAEAKDEERQETASKS